MEESFGERPKPSLSGLFDTLPAERPKPLTEVLKNITQKPLSDTPNVIRIRDKSWLNAFIKGDELLASVLQVGGRLKSVNPTTEISTHGTMEIDLETKHSNESSEKKIPTTLEMVQLEKFEHGKLVGAKGTNVVLLTAEGGLRKGLNNEVLDEARKWLRANGLSVSYQAPVSQFVLGATIRTESVAFVIDE